MNIRIIIFIIAFLGINFCIAQELVLEQLDLNFDQPVDLVSTYIEGDTRLFVVEKTGKIYIIDDPQSETPIKLDLPFLDLSSKVNTQQEGGLLGLAFSPEFETKGYFYVNYTFNDVNNGQKFSTRISRFNVFEDNVEMADMTSEVEVITIEQPAFNNNGGDIVFGSDEMLYIPMGDGGGSNDQFDNGQNLQSFLGKILRLDVKQLPYEVPGDNPFTQNPFILDEIWALGLRNPWKVSFDSETHDLWIADVGQNDFEEVDVQLPAESALNYGWSCFEGTDMFGPFGCIDEIIHREPVFEYDHLGTQKAIVGGYVYRGGRHPDLYGKYVFSDYLSSNLFWLLEKNDNVYQETKYELTESEIPERISSFGEDSKGELYFATFENGKVWKLMTKVISETSIHKEMNIIIHPNPVINSLKFSGKIPEKAILRVMDYSGRLILETSFEAQIDVSKLSAGIYHAYVQTFDGNWSASFVKM